MTPRQKIGLRKARDTRALYRFEGQYPWPRRVVMCLPMFQLRSVADRVCREMKIKLPVKLIAHKGCDRSTHGHWVSWCELWTDRTVIRLARHERNLQILMHELAHALLPVNADHGPQFSRMLCHLMGRFCGMSEPELLTHMQMAGVRV